MDYKMRVRVAEVLRAAGVDGRVYIPEEMDRTELVLVLDTLASVPKAELTERLAKEFGRVVWITTCGDAWKGRVEPLLNSD